VFGGGETAESHPKIVLGPLAKKTVVHQRRKSAPREKFLGRGGEGESVYGELQRIRGKRTLAGRPMSRSGYRKPREKTIVRGN